MLLASVVKYFHWWKTMKISELELCPKKAELTGSRHIRQFLAFEDIARALSQLQ